MADHRRLPRPKSSTVRETSRRNDLPASSPQRQPIASNKNQKSKEKQASTEEKASKNPSSSAWSWIPSLISTIFSSSKTEEPEASVKEPSPTPKTPNNSVVLSPQPRDSVKLPPKPYPVEISPFPVDINQNEADVKCSTALGEVSPQTTDEGSRKTSKEPAFAPSPKKLEDQDFLPLPGDLQGPTMISVNAEEDQSPNADALSKDFVGPIVELKLEPPKLKEIFEMESSSNNMLAGEPSIKPLCSFCKISFSRSQTVYLLPNTRQRLHKKIVRSRHDAWRRYGALMVIHEIGGWSYTINGKAKHFQRIEKGAPLPPPPALPPILTEEEFQKRPIITIPANKDSKSKRQRNNRNAKEEKKGSKEGDSDTSLSEEDPPSC